MSPLPSKADIDGFTRKGVGTQPNASRGAHRSCRPQGFSGSNGSANLERAASGMSALPPKAGIRSSDPHVRQVPIAAVGGYSKCGLFDHLFGGNDHRCWNCKAEHLRRFYVDD